MSGLVNNGNHCYMNTLIQCIRSVPGAIFIEKYVQGKCVDMKTLQKMCKMDLAEQNDVQEVFMAIAENEKTISEMTRGENKRTTICGQCGERFVNREAFVCVDLPLTKEDLVGCMKEHYSVELLWGWECSVCKFRGASKTMSRISKLPHLLVISLQRFDNRKLRVPCSIEIEGYIYTFRASANHIGTQGNGHYTATVRRETGWYSIDDEKVAECKQPETTSEAYLLFFARDVS